MRIEMIRSVVGVRALWAGERALSHSQHRSRQTISKPNQRTSPVCVNSCSANLDGLVYALSHPAYKHLYFFSPAGVVDRDLDLAFSATGR